MHSVRGRGPVAGPLSIAAGSVIVEVLVDWSPALPRRFSPQKWSGVRADFLHVKKKRYLTESLLETVILLIVICGKVCFCSVKVTCVDFFSLVLKSHLWNHFSRVDTSLESG